MSDDLHNIDDLFKKALEEHTELPSSSVWDNIDKSLDKKKVISTLKKYTKLKWAAAVLLLFSFGMAMYILHIRIKDNELVKQNNAARNLKNQHTQTNNKLKDSASLAGKDNTGIEKTKINEELKKQESSNPSIMSRDKINHPEENRTVAGATAWNRQTWDRTATKLPSEGKTGRYISQQNQKQLLLNKSAVKLPEKPAGTDSENNTTGNIVQSIVPNNDKGITANKEHQEKLQDGFVSIKEKCPGGIPAISQLGDRFQTLLTKPISQIPKIPTNDIVTLKNIKTAPLKHNRTMTLKQRNIKNDNSPLLSAIIFFSPDLVSTNIKNDHPHFTEDNSHEIKKDEKIKSSSTIGVLIDYITGKNWKLESGITFSTRFTDIDPKTIYARPDNNGNINYRFNCSAGYSFVTLKSAGLPPVSGDSISALRSKNVLQYIGVPVVVKYMFSKGRLGITPGAGISANFLTRGKIETTIPTASGNESVTSNNIQGLKPMYFTGIANVGAQYNLNKTFGLIFMPSVRVALSSINKDGPVKTYLNSVSFATGIIIKL